jgi:excisionase family DNA binding protein
LEPDILTIEQVAKYLKLQPQTIYKWAQEGQIPAAKVGKEWRFRKAILDEWLDTAIHLSKGGFDLMLQKSWLEARRSGVTREEIDAMIRGRWEDKA